MEWFAFIAALIGGLFILNMVFAIWSAPMDAYLIPYERGVRLFGVIVFLFMSWGQAVVLFRYFEELWK